MQDKKKLLHKQCRCPYALCPSNEPFRGARKSRMKFKQKISPMVFQFECKDCGCLTNFCYQAENIKEKMASYRNPALAGGTASFNLWGN